LAHERIATAIVKEVPITSISALIKGFNDPISPLANGSGCGNGCGNNCRSPLGLHFDEFGQAGIPNDEFMAAVRDPEGLVTAIKDQINKML
jgi:hypothetical protein